MDKINLEGKRILVTGGNGYLGRFLVEALKKQKANVFILDKNVITSENTFQVDITIKEEVKEAINKIQPEIIVHLAAILNRERNFDNFELSNNINHLGTYNLLEALKNIPYQNFIFTSTSEIYGDNKAPFHEQQLPDAASPYSLTKVYSENLINTFSKLYDKKFTILRLFNFFGKNMPAAFFIPQLIESLKTKESFDMTKGEQIRDFLYVDDVVSALILSAKQAEPKNETFNVCSNTGVSLKELVKTIQKVLQSDCKISFGALPYRNNEVWNMVGDNSKIQRALNFTPKYNIEEAIKEVLKENN